jgi:hypothetical protein
MERIFHFGTFINSQIYGDCARKGVKLGETHTMGLAIKLLQKTLAESLQRLQERNQLVLLRGAERAVVIDDSRGFASVAQNRIVTRE